MGNNPIVKGLFLLISLVFIIFLIIAVITLTNHEVKDTALKKEGSNIIFSEESYVVSSETDKRKEKGFDSLSQDSILLQQSTIIGYDKKIDEYPKRIDFTEGLDIESDASITGYAVSDSTDKIVGQANKFFDKYSNILGINKEDLKIRDVIKEKNFERISFEQTYKGIPVYNSNTNLAKSKDKWVVFNTEYVHNLEIDINPKITKEDAIKNVQKKLKVNENPQEGPVLLIYSKIDEKGLHPKLAYKLDFPISMDGMNDLSGLNIDSYNIVGESFEKVKPSIFVDATNGEIIDIINNLRSAVTSGKIYGEIVDEHLGKAKLEKPFSNVYLYGDNYQMPNGKIIPDGYYSIDSENGFYTLLRGPYIDIRNYSNGYQSVTNLFYYFPMWYGHYKDINWSELDISYKKEESNLFYYSNLAHDYFSTKNIPGIDNQLTGVVEDNCKCNAYLDGSTLGFCAPTADCESFALSSEVIYHEYTHNVVRQVAPKIDRTYSGETGNMNEGYSDYFACTISNDSCMAENFIIKKTCLRNCENTKKYPDDYGSEPHTGAEIISGALWDIRKELGKDTADELALAALSNDPTSFDELGNYFILSDDAVYGDGNLSTGTPHKDVICNSFFKHGLMPPYCGDILKIYYKIDIPTNINHVHLMNITGYASGQNFSSYSLFYYNTTYVNKSDSKEWIEIITNFSRANNGILYKSFDVTKLNEGLNYIKFVVNTTNGEQFEQIKKFGLTLMGLDISSYIQMQRYIPINGYIMGEYSSYKLFYYNTSYINSDQDSKEWIEFASSKSGGSDFSGVFFNNFDVMILDDGANKIKISIFKKDGSQIERISSITVLLTDLKEPNKYYVYTNREIINFTGTLKWQDSVSVQYKFNNSKSWFNEGVILTNNGRGSFYNEYIGKLNISQADNKWCNQADLNKDSWVDEKDKSLIDSWKTIICNKNNKYCSGVDINKNGKIDEGDYSVIDSEIGRKDCMGITEGFYYIRMTQNFSGRQRQNLIPVYISTSMEEGWPKDLNEWRIYPVISDINNDGYKEIIVYGGGILEPSTYKLKPDKIYAFNYKGENLNNFPISLEEQVFGADILPAIGDINNDGYKEIVFVRSRMPPDIPSLYVYNHKGEKILDIKLSYPSLYFNGGFAYYSFISLMDINNDGYLEIAIGSETALTVLDHNGDTLSGWPKELWPMFNYSPGPASFGNLDNDSDYEILFIGYSNGSLNGKGYDSGMIYAWNPDGTNVNGWPVYATGQVLSPSVVTGDINNDGKTEVIAGFTNTIYISNKDAGGVYVYNGSGSLLEGWPQLKGYEINNNPVIFDTGSGQKGIIINSYNHNTSTNVLNSSGSIQSGWPINIHVGSGQSIAYDVNEDSQVDILTVGSSANMNRYLDQLSPWIFAWDKSGKNIEGFPKYINAMLYYPIYVGDIDNDSNLELIAFSGSKMYGNRNPLMGTIFVWDLNAKDNKKIRQWAQYQHDAQHTGCYDCDKIALEPVGPRPQSKLVNNGINAVSGTLIIKLEKYADNGWIVEREVVNKNVNLDAGGVLKLDTGKDNLGKVVFEGFNNLNVTANSAGKYRVYGEFKSAANNVNASWEFNIV